MIFLNFICSCNHLSPRDHFGLFCACDLIPVRSCWILSLKGKSHGSLGRHFVPCSVCELHLINKDHSHTAIESYPRMLPFFFFFCKSLTASSSQSAWWHKHYCLGLCFLDVGCYFHHLQSSYVGNFMTFLLIQSSSLNMGAISNRWSIVQIKISGTWSFVHFGLRVCVCVREEEADAMMKQ